ncbi:response regulator [Nonomuraea fuscirosea]|jgi:CheY-like chemotaxis protein|uniref:Response regulator receiver domain-containing protein n=1 Tax=Nonomuraea fuscirosea TaxID=1291556 RepID=A0A2T0N5G6_9ACTN|nr:response regulator [Nonomuraea fuscirosea]PRX67595.1 response regulator receiver domain-containing protein [Nonomuraea fuscirosea]WSA57393.1 response regulator [Nonomuraea fuscirosea]
MNTAELRTILVVEDDPADQVLIQEAFEEHAETRRTRPNLLLAWDGEQALDILFRRGAHAEATRPDLVILDLNLPKYDGRAVLEQIKSDLELRTIPVVVFSTSSQDEDIIGTYRLHANAFVTKPTGFDDFTAVVHQIQEFFTRTARLPAPAA